MYSVCSTDIPVTILDCDCCKQNRILVSRLVVTGNLIPWTLLFAHIPQMLHSWGGDCNLRLEGRVCSMCVLENYHHVTDVLNVDASRRIWYSRPMLLEASLQPLCTTGLSHKVTSSRSSTLQDPNWYLSRWFPTQCSEWWSTFHYRVDMMTHLWLPVHALLRQCPVYLSRLSL